MYFTQKDKNILFRIAYNLYFVCCVGGCDKSVHRTKCFYYILHISLATYMYVEI